jgi:hypothetical protein
MKAELTILCSLPDFVPRKDNVSTIEIAPLLPVEEEEEEEVVDVTVTTTATTATSVTSPSEAPLKRQQEMEKRSLELLAEQAMQEGQFEVGQRDLASDNDGEKAESPVDSSSSEVSEGVQGVQVSDGTYVPSVGLEATNDIESTRAPEALQAAAAMSAVVETLKPTADTETDPVVVSPARLSDLSMNTAYVVDPASGLVSEEVQTQSETQLESESDVVVQHEDEDSSSSSSSSLARDDPIVVTVEEEGEGEILQQR